MTRACYGGILYPERCEKGGERLSEKIDGLGDAIIRYRAEHSLNQTEFAERCGITKQTVGAIETGRRGANKAQYGITKLTKEKILRVINNHKEEGE